MTIVDALKALVTAIGGSYSADDDTVSEILAKVTTAFESGEFVTDLPTVSSADNGKLFGVTGGKWDKVNAPVELPAVTGDDNGKALLVGSGAWGKYDLPKETVFVPFTVTTVNDVATVTTTANFSDVVADVEAGKNVIAAVDVNGALMLYAPLSIKSPITNPIVLRFSVVADFASSGEPSAPCLRTIQFTANAVSIDSVDLAVAT